MITKGRPLCMTISRIGNMSRTVEIFDETSNMSEQTMQKVDGEVRRIIDQQYSLARKLIEDNRDKMHAMAKALLEWETIDSEQLDDIMAGKEPRPPKDWTPRTPSSGSDSGGSAPAVKPDAAPTAA